MPADFDALVREANRAGRRGRDALAVLQDAVLESFGPAFERAAAVANAIQHHAHSAERLVVFYPVAKRPSANVVTLFMPPFDIVAEAQLAALPVTGAIVWSDRTGFDTVSQQERWRAADRARRAGERARPAVILDVERIRLDSQGYDSSGRYFGPGAPLFRVTGREPIPLDAARDLIADYGRYRQLGYEANDGYWIDAELRAPDARAARQRVATDPHQCAIAMTICPSMHDRDRDDGTAHAN